MPRSNIFVVRGYNTILGQKTPKVPATWTVIPESSGWCTVYPNWPDSRFIHCRCCAVSGANAFFALFGPRAWLDQIAALVTYSWPSIAALRADNGTVATQIKAAWLDDRQKDQNGTIVNGLEPIQKLRQRMAGFADDDGEASIQ